MSNVINLNEKRKQKKLTANNSTGTITSEVKANQAFVENIRRINQLLEILRITHGLPAKNISENLEQPPKKL